MPRVLIFEYCHAGTMLFPFVFAILLLGLFSDKYAQALWSTIGAATVSGGPPLTSAHVAPARR